MMEYVRRRPPLYRLARYLRWSAILALIVVIFFLISTILSAVEFASHLKITVPGGGGLSYNYTQSGGFTASFVVNITNGGYYPLVLDLSVVANTAQGPLIPYTTTGVVTFPAGNRTTQFGFTLHIPEAILAADEAHLLVDNTPVSGDIWFNGSYAWIYQFGFSLAANGTWGAPFENLTVAPGHTTSSGGQTTVPVTVNFTNNASFPDAGNLTFQLINGGTDCGAPVGLPIDAPSHQNYSGRVNLTGPSSCMVSGATVAVTYSLGSLTFSLPSGRLG
jgi:hypothetical protein